VPTLRAIGIIVPLGLFFTACAAARTDTATSPSTRVEATPTAATQPTATSQPTASAPPSVVKPSPPAAATTAGASPTASDAGHPFAGEEAWIAYNTDEVRLIHPDGTDDHEVAADVPEEHLHPNWSPDGSRLVFTRRSAKDILYELDVATDVARVLWPCDGRCLGDDEAVYSPDGSRIAFIRALGPFQDGQPADCSLWLGDPATGEVERLTSTPGCSFRETFPHWSRDGSRLAYYRGVYTQTGATTATALYVLDVATGEETKLTDDALFAGDSDWSADDEWLVFSTYPLNDFQQGRVSDLYRIQPDGTGLEPLTDYGTPGLRATQPRYTPDGEWILFTAVTPQSRELWVMPAQGGDPIVVARGGIRVHGAWQPTGDHH
jgi:Tol biopolymer transport system component